MNDKVAQVLKRKFEQARDNAKRDAQECHDQYIIGAARFKEGEAAAFDEVIKALEALESTDPQGGVFLGGSDTLQDLCNREGAHYALVTRALDRGVTLQEAIQQAKG
jgi:hypothetical protein